MKFYINITTSRTLYPSGQIEKTKDLCIQGRKNNVGNPAFIKIYHGIKPSTAARAVILQEKLKRKR